MARFPHLSLFAPLTKAFLVPTKIATAVARSRGQGRAHARRALRASLDGGEHGRRLQDQGTFAPRLRIKRQAMALAMLVAGVWGGSVVPSKAAQESDKPVPISGIIDEAAGRFGLPAVWIYAVIKAESGGDPNALSSKGAMGLMQLMPATWRALSERHRLGPDPFERRANVLAGAAYLRQMFDQFGPNGFLAAYNAGPGRYADVLAGRRTLPAETASYVATVKQSIRGENFAVPGPMASKPFDWRAANLFAGPTREPGGPVAAGIFVPDKSGVRPW